jgi:hypothetical protein
MPTDCSSRFFLSFGFEKRGDGHPAPLGLSARLRSAFAVRCHLDRLPRGTRSGGRWKRAVVGHRRVVGTSPTFRTDLLKHAALVAGTGTGLLAV